MDPLSVITTLISITRYLITVAEKVKQNSQECKRLAKHVDGIVRVIQTECRDGVPKDLEARLVKLSKTIGGLTGMLDDLDTKPWLMKVLWRGDVSDRIADTYKVLAEAIQLCKMGMTIDMRRIMQEHEEARRMDTEAVAEKLDQGLSNDHEIISRLEVHRAQMQEAMVAIHMKLQRLEHGSAERPLLEQGMHAMQRRSGGMQLVPDEFVITSLDVIIREDEKLGEGGFGQVFRGDWQGVVVAVKVFEKGIPHSILQKELDVWKRLRHPHILQFHGACSIANPPFAVCAYKANGDALVYMSKHPTVDRLRLLHHASLGLSYLHSNSVVHGDLKASNILVDEHGHACLADFGLSKIKTSTTTVRKPLADAQVGTARWMAPEQMTLGVINRMTDAYSFGMTMYEVFVGIPPFANTPDGLLMGVVVDRGLRPPRPDGQDTLKQGLGDRMWALIESCWAAGPDYRPTARTIVSRIEECRRAPKSSAPNTGTHRVVSASADSARSSRNTVLRKGQVDQEPVGQLSTPALPPAAGPEARAEVQALRKPPPIPPQSVKDKSKLPRKPRGLAAAIAASGRAMAAPAAGRTLSGNMSPLSQSQSTSWGMSATQQLGSVSTNADSGAPANNQHFVSEARRKSLHLPISPQSRVGSFRNLESSRDKLDSIDGHTEETSSDEELGLDDVTGFAVASGRRNSDFHELFPSIPDGDYLIEDYGCALMREILIQGRLYISENYLCFHANIFGWITNLSIPTLEIMALEKKMTSFVIPNAILVATRDNKYSFSSFVSRDTTYDVIRNIWQVARPASAMPSTDVVRRQDEHVWRSTLGPGDVPAAADRVTAAPRKATMCECGKADMHYSAAVMEAVFPGTPEHMFNLIFASGFTNGFMRDDQKFMDIQVSDWSPSSPDAKLIARNMSYTKPLNGSVGPKQTKCELRDETVHFDMDNYVSIVTTTRTPDVPSGAVFSVKTRTCITWASASSTRVVVTTQVEWSGRSFIKGLIERAAVDGQHTYYLELEKAMRAYIHAHLTEFIPEGFDIDAVMEQVAVATSKTTSCGCGRANEHYSTIAIEATYWGTPEKICNMMFASGFVKDFMRDDQKLMDIQSSDWQPSSNIKLMIRNMSYIKPLHSSVGPKQTKCELKDETVHFDADDYISILTTTRTPDVPSGSAFSVKTRTCLTWADSMSTKVVVTTQLEWTGRSFIKNMIEKAAVDGQHTYYADLDKAMRAHIDSHPTEFPKGIAATTNAPTVAARTTMLIPQPVHLAEYTSVAAEKAVALAKKSSPYFLFLVPVFLSLFYLNLI